MPGKADPNAVPRATARKLAFAAKYVETNNGTEAAIAAGYSPVSAGKHVSRLVSDGVVVAEITRLRNIVNRKIESNTIAKLTEVKEHLTAQMRGDAMKAVIEGLEATATALRARVDAMEAAGADPALILREHHTLADREMEIGRLKLAQATVANKAAETMAKIRGAMDPSRRPLPDKGEIMERLMLSFVKGVDGNAVLTKVRQIKGRTIDVTPVPSPPSSPEPES